MFSTKVTATANNVGEKNEAKADEEDISLKGKIKAMVKKYGAVAVGTYLTVYVTTLGSMFVALDYDIFNAATFGLDPAAAVQKVSTGRTILMDSRRPKTSSADNNPMHSLLTLKSILSLDSFVKYLR